MSEWHTFFAMVGSAAGALTGLMFVVTALMQGQRMPAGAIRLRRSFATPTIVHFTVVLALAGALSMPRISRAAVGMFLSFAGGALVLYALWVIVNARRFRDTYRHRSRGCDLALSSAHRGLPQPLPRRTGLLVLAGSPWPAGWWRCS